MNIGSICSRRILTIDHADSPALAATLMREHHVGALVIVTETADGWHVTGIVTDRDLAISVLARGLDGNGRVGDLASQPVASVSEDDELSVAIAAMRESGVRRLLVTGAEQQLVGFVSFDDVLRACAEQVAGLAEVIRAGMDREVAETVAPPLPPMLRVPAMGTVA